MTTDADNMTPAERREAELAIFRKRVNQYGLKLMAANRGLRNQFKMSDAKPGVGDAAK